MTQRGIERPDSVGTGRNVEDVTTGASIIVPTYNEVENIIEVVTRCVEAVEADQTEVVVVDDDSPDGTADLVQMVFGDDDRVRLIRREGDRGLGRSISEGLRKASNRRCAVIDADLQHPPEQLGRLLSELDDETRLVVASRYADGGEVENWSHRRKLLSRLGSSLTNALIAPSREVTDPLSGFFAVDRAVLENVTFDSEGYKILLELLVNADIDTDSITEVPYTFSGRDRGESSFGLRQQVAFFIQLICLWFGQWSATIGRSDTSYRRTGADSTPEDDGPRVALVTAYPPTRDGVADYARKLVRGYSGFCSALTVIASGTDEPSSRTEGPQSGTDDSRRTDVTIERCWEKGTLRGLYGMFRALLTHRRDHDVVHFNIKPTYFGAKNTHRFLSLCVPLVVRVLLRERVVVTMHDIVDGIDTEKTGEKVGTVQRIGAKVATQTVLLAGPVTVTTKRQKRLLDDTYPCGEVHHLPHGVEEHVTQSPVTIDPFRILIFGYISPYKDYGTCFEAFERLRAVEERVELWVVGGAHPDHPEYASNVREACVDRPGVRFFGYVSETEMSAVFERASVVLLPYETAPGVSGVYQEAKARGLPVVVYDTEEVVAGTVETGGTAVTVPPGDAEVMAGELARLREEPGKLAEMAEANAATSEATMEEVARHVVEVAGASDRASHTETDTAQGGIGE